MWPRGADRRARVRPRAFSRPHLRPALPHSRREVLPIMPTITRETFLIDRRQPMLRWSAVFAGGACSVGIWLVLELLGVGAGLYAHHAADSTGAMHAASVATRVWSLVAQVI